MVVIATDEWHRHGNEFISVVHIHRCMTDDRTEFAKQQQKHVPSTFSEFVKNYVRIALDLASSKI